MECRVLTSQPTPARVCGEMSLCKTFKSCVGSGDSSTRDQPKPSTTLYIVERKLACFACLCYHPFHWLRLLTLAFSIGHCQCSHIFVSCWPSAFNLQVTWIKKFENFGSFRLPGSFYHILLAELKHLEISCRGIKTYSTNVAFEPNTLTKHTGKSFRFQQAI